MQASFCCWVCQVPGPAQYCDHDLNMAEGPWTPLGVDQWLNLLETHPEFAVAWDRLGAQLARDCTRVHVRHQSSEYVVHQSNEKSWGPVIEVPML